MGCRSIQAPATMHSPCLCCCTVALPVKVQPQLLKRYCPVKVRYGGLWCQPYRLVVIVHRIISSTLRSSSGTRRKGSISISVGVGKGEMQRITTMEPLDGSGKHIA